MRYVYNKCSARARTKVVRRKHIIKPTGSGAYSSTCFQWEGEDVPVNVNNILGCRWSNPGPCITNVFATRRKNFSQWYRSFQRKLLSHWLKFLQHVAITLVIQGPEVFVNKLQAGNDYWVFKLNAHWYTVWWNQSTYHISIKVCCFYMVCLLCCDYEEWLRLDQNVSCVIGDSFMCTFKESHSILIWISLKCIPERQTDIK